jgi:cyclic-di-GMP-binding protein
LELNYILKTTNNITMPSFDFSSKVDLQTLDNAINVVKKEVSNRYDFKGSHVVIELNKKDFTLLLESDSDMKIGQIVDVLISRSIKQGLAAEIYDLSKAPYVSGKVTKQDITVRNGIKQDDAKKIVKAIKDAGLKVQAAIMDDIVRVTGKKIDDLQEVIAASKTWNFGIALQVVNMKS